MYSTSSERGFGNLALMKVELSYKVFQLLNFEDRPNLIIVSYRAEIYRFFQPNSYSSGGSLSASTLSFDSIDTFSDMDLNF